jgi:hypothetical protein
MCLVASTIQLLTTGRMIGSAAVVNHLKSNTFGHQLFDSVMHMKLSMEDGPLILHGM